MKGKYFKFYDCCKIVVGANRSAIYDLPRSSFFFLPNTIVEVLKKYEKENVQKLFEDFFDQKEHLQKYFDYLLNNELIFLTDHPENFPEAEKRLQKPHFLDILTLEIEHLQDFKKEFLEHSIDKTGVEHLVLINTSNCLKNLKLVLKTLDRSRIKEITFLSLFRDSHVEEIKNIQRENERLKEIVFFKSQRDFTDSQHNTKYTSMTLYELYNKRIEDVNSFSLNQLAFLEAQHKNLFFNRRAYIKNNGDIKPSYFHNDCYGNLKKNKLKDVVLRSDFQEIWNLTKDNIEVCRDCEFRYMCPDNRIPVKRNDQFVHMSSCRYNPYTNYWDG